MQINKIEVIIKNVGGPLYVKTIENTLESFVAIVGGYIKPVAVSNDGLLMYCNEEGLPLNLPLNFHIMGTPIVGDVIFFRHLNGIETSVRDKDMKYLENLLK